MKSLLTTVTTATLGLKKAQRHKRENRNYRSTLIWVMCFCTFLWLKTGVGLKLFQALDADRAAAQLDDAATFEIVEDCSSSLTRGSDETRNVMMREWNEVISGSSLDFSGARCEFVQEFADAC